MPYPFTAVYIRSASGTDDGHYQYGTDTGPISALMGGKRFSAIPDKPLIMKVRGDNPRCRILVDSDDGPVIVYNGSVTFNGPGGRGAFLVRAPKATRRVFRYTRLDPSKPSKVAISIDAGPDKPIPPDEDVIVTGKEIAVVMSVSTGGVVVSWKA